MQNKGKLLIGEKINKKFTNNKNYTAQLSMLYFNIQFE